MAARTLLPLLAALPSVLSFPFPGPTPVAPGHLLEARAETTITVGAWTTVVAIPSGVANPSGDAGPSSAPNVSSTPVNGSRAHHGIQPNSTSLNGIHVGFLPDWARQTPGEMNTILGRPMPLIGDYVGVSRNDYGFGALDWHRQAVLQAAANNQSVYVPAILPSFSLANWTDDMSEALAAKAAEINSQGVTVWLRFAYEMNGAWMAYGHDPQNYVRAFRSVANAVRRNSQAGRTYLLWAPNVSTGDPNDPIGGYSAYYPGKEYVDIAGLSLYFFGDSSQTQNALPAPNLFQVLFKSFHDFYGKDHPIIITETSAPYHYAMPSQFAHMDIDREVDPPELSSLRSAGSSVREVDVKQAWLNQLAGNETASLFPNLTAVMLFNYMKTSDKGQILDFRYIRSVGGNAEVEGMTRNALSNGISLPDIPDIPPVTAANYGTEPVTTYQVTAVPTPWSDYSSIRASQSSVASTRVASSVAVSPSSSSSSSASRSASISGASSSSSQSASSAGRTSSSAAARATPQGADQDDSSSSSASRRSSSASSSAPAASTSVRNEGQARVAQTQNVVESFFSSVGAQMTARPLINFGGSSSSSVSRNSTSSASTSTRN